MKNLSRSERRAMERKFAKAGKIAGKLTAKKLAEPIAAGVFYKDNDPSNGFSIFATKSEHEDLFNMITKFYDQARKTFLVEQEAVATGNHPDYVGVTMDQVVEDTITNMHIAIKNWNLCAYNSESRRMGYHTVDFDMEEAAPHLFYIILGVVYGELTGKIKSDEYNGMSFSYIEHSNAANALRWS